MQHEPQTWADLQDAGNAQSQLILQAIARHADWDTGVCWPRISTLCRMSKCSDKTCRRHLKKLQIDGLIAIRHRQSKSGDYTSSEITLVGYEEWIATNRCGGKVRRPKVAKRYPDSALDGEGSGQSDHTPHDDVGADAGEGSGQIDQGSGQSDHTPLGSSEGSSQFDQTSGHSADQTSGQQVTGHRTSLELDSNKFPPDPPRGAEASDEGWAKGWDDGAQDAVDALRKSAIAAHVATAFVDDVRGTLSPPSGSDGAAFVRQLANRLGRFSAAVLSELAELEHREQAGPRRSRGRLRPAAALEAAATAIMARNVPASAAVASPDVPAELAQLWARVIGGLIQLLGEARVTVLFGQVVPVELRGDRLRLSVAAYLAGDITDRYASHLRAVLRSVANIADFEIVTARPRTAQ